MGTDEGLMMVRLIWLPNGEEAQTGSFLGLRHTEDDAGHEVIMIPTFEGALQGLKDEPWPVGHKPWMQRGDGSILTPAEIVGLLPE